MKNFEVKKEIWLWVIAILPILYLMYVWNTLPEIVPTHFGMDGQPNDWSHKRVLIYIVLGMTVGLYALLTLIPVIDPKGKIESMGNKYFLLKLFLMLFMSIICLYSVRMSVNKNAGNVSFIFILIGGLFAFLGNYMQSIKPNYFIGIRTPWTLESETVWRKTHQLGGKLYFIAGLLIMVLPFVIKENFRNVFVGIIITASLIPVVYSFILFRQEKQNSKG